MSQTVRFHETLRRLAMIDETFVEKGARVRLDLSPAAALDPKAHLSLHHQAQIACHPGTTADAG